MRRNYPVSLRNRYFQAKRDALGPVDPPTLAEIDAALDASKQNRYAEARRLFTALRDKHPEWPSVAAEAARAWFNVNDDQEAQRTLSLLTANRLTPDADFVPTYAALFAAAGRALKGQRYDVAAAFIARAQAVTEPAVFQTVLQDPPFWSKLRGSSCRASTGQRLSPSPEKPALH